MQHSVTSSVVQGRLGEDTGTGGSSEVVGHSRRLHHTHIGFKKGFINICMYALLTCQEGRAN